MHLSSVFSFPTGTPLVAVLLAAAAFQTFAQEEQKASDRAVVLHGEAGPYTIPQWKQDWPGCAFEGGIKEGRVSMVEHDKTQWLRVSYAPGQIGPEKSGAGWRLPVGSHESAELSYTLQFGRNFDWVKGGKLPGLCGGPDNVSGGRPANGNNGFSARLMWRRDGRGEAYVYHKNQPTNYGDRFDFPADFRFPTGTPVHVRMQVAMNAPGKRNGTLRVWVAQGTQPPQLLVERTDLEWRNDTTFGVDSLYFETFHGGSDLSWAPTRPCWADFGNFQLRFAPPKDGSKPSPQ